MPYADSCSQTMRAVRCSSKPNSGCACRSRRTAVNWSCHVRMRSTGLFTGSMRGGEPLDAKPRVHDVIKEIDDQIDQHEYERDQAQVGGHHRDVGEIQRLAEQ